MTRQKIAMLGAGSWGTAMAIHLAQLGHHVMLWGHTPQHVALMIKEHVNSTYLPGIVFPKTLVPCADLNLCLEQADEVFIAVPSHAFRTLLPKIPLASKGITWLTKGIDPQSNQLLSEVAQQHFGDDLDMAVLSGPSFAKEVAQHLPTALTLASQRPVYQKRIQQLLHHHPMRVYLSDDLIGVQICGAIKNILAIACGISDGLGYGANAKAALITRGLAEMSRLGLKLGAQQETFLGLAGVGDLVLTCTDNQSRNRRFGLLIGKQLPLDEAEKQIGQVVEGKYNAEQICQLATNLNVEMPICTQINKLLHQHITPKDAVHVLMNRPAKEE